MGGRRFPLAVTLVAVLVVMSSLPSWGWDFVPALRGNLGACSQDYNKSFFGGRAEFSVGWISATAHGSNGASPAEGFSESGAGDAASGVAAQVSLMADGPMGTNAKITGGFTGVNIGGKASTFSGDFTPGGAVPGNTVSAQMDLRLWNINLDGSWSSGGIYRVGPRLQWLQYIDTFTFTNITALTSTSSSRSIAMFGIGGFAELALPGFGLSSRYGNLAPVLKIAGTVGAGNSMRYGWVEGYLQFINIPFSEFGASLKGEVGYMWFDFRERRDDITPGAVIPRNASYWLSVPIIKASLSF
jgi:hypothetical protein